MLVALLPRFIEYVSRQIRVKLLNDSGIYEIYNNTYLPNGLDISRHYGIDIFRAKIEDGLLIDENGKTYSSLYSLNCEFSKEKEDIWDIWKFENGKEKLCFLDSYGVHCWFSKSKEKWKPWGTGRIRLALQATWISWTRCKEQVRSNVRSWITILILLLVMILIINIWNFDFQNKPNSTEKQYFQNYP